MKGPRNETELIERLVRQGVYCHAERVSALVCANAGPINITVHVPEWAYEKWGTKTQERRTKRTPKRRK